MATPHSHHYQNTRLALEAGKHVLCEKAFTTNAAQARKLVEIAREKKLFLMEAVWTRYFPISVELRTLVKEGKIGEVKRVFADLSDGGDAEKKWGTEHRMVKLALAGGALLDRKSPFPFQKYSFTLFPLGRTGGMEEACISLKRLTDHCYSRHLQSYLGLPVLVPHPASRQA